MTDTCSQPVPFTGSLLLCDGFVGEEMTISVVLDNGKPALLPYRGTYPPTRYQTVYELTFEQGKLVKTTDRSSDIEAYRQITQAEQLQPGDREKWQTKIRPWISAYHDLTHLDQDYLD
ncbi:hypothetical protein H6F86_28310 [Phormidium sp. FACHB-592]|uniref:Uncharacterized protein n=1 Tax=Stenomitos frigidus AS-A4 TaxID=2933935 RepID=A0ABV0KCZ7_9CYAN|nr:hypothetical protein [Phormidium sp. FACHB-592]MBD2077721.1 hypothetical protein [Phormidium sp. FACHB-592]